MVNSPSLLFNDIISEFCVLTLVSDGKVFSVSSVHFHRLTPRMATVHLNNIIHQFNRYCVPSNCQKKQTTWKEREKKTNLVFLWKFWVNGIWQWTIVVFICFIIFVVVVVVCVSQLSFFSVEIAPINPINNTNSTKKTSKTQANTVATFADDSVFCCCFSIQFIISLIQFNYITKSLLCKNSLNQMNK